MRVEVLNNEALKLAMAGDAPSAEKLLRADLAAWGENPAAHYLLGVVLLKQNRVNEAIESLRRAMAIVPDDAEVHTILGQALLTSGDYKRGFAELEWRWRSHSHAGLIPKIPQPRWTGGFAQLTGKTLLLLGEQGFGDTIQMARYIPLLIERGINVIVQARPEIAELLRQMPGRPLVIVAGESMPGFDYLAPMMSLPLAFNTTIKSIPAKVPYLIAPAKTVSRWAERIKSDKPKVGLCWQGNPKHLDDRNRSMSFESLSPLLESERIAFLSLQNAIASPAPMIDLSSTLHDFSDQAAVIANLDLVISVDTSIAHLAGAMGTPVWTMLPFAADWRWMVDRADSPWYPTMRLFRQKAAGDWAGVIEAVRSELLSRFNVR